MPQAWRIVRTERVSEAFTGEGARLAGGRWNSRQVRVIYTSEHQSLAALELLAHINPRIELSFSSFRIEWDDLATEKVYLNQLPPAWRDYPPTNGTIAIGDLWAKRQRTAILAVPSVLIPEEVNYLLNPAHPDFKRIEIGLPRLFNFDQRLLA